MTFRTRLLAPIVLAVAAAATLAAQQSQQSQQPQQSQQSQTQSGDSQDNSRFRFRSAVELINVTATVTDSSGRFVPNLRQEDFRIFEDGVEQPITHFSPERVPVSLGIVLDTSNSMEGEKIDAARSALSRFLFDLLDPNDEVFLYRFSNTAQLVEGWTRDRERLQSRLGRLTPNGGTAMYDAVAEAVPLAQTGENRKKAIVIISDGNDTSSRTSVSELKHEIRESEVMVYAVGIDGRSTWTNTRSYPPRQPPTMPFPFPFPGGRRVPSAPQGPRAGGRMGDERVNVAALRDLTDDSGGRTEIVREARDLEPATSGIADELSKQYSLGYPSTGKRDGRWHEINVQVHGSYQIRARRGYVASQ